MAQNRSDKLKRLVTVQRHMERMAEIELSKTTQARQMVGDAMTDTLAALTSFDPIHQALSGSYSTRYGRLKTQDKQLENLQEVNELRVLRERTKADKLEEHFLEARQHEEREADDKSIEDLMEIYLSSSAPASSKLPER
jgi:aminoglycoside phosphotransferase (APT) family kinase protein